jgi:hypothetical protein
VDFILMLSSQLRLPKQDPDVLRDLNLTRMRAASVVDEWVEGADRTQHSLCTHSGADLGKQSKMRCLIQGKGCDRCRECGAIQNTEVLLGGERDRRDTMCVERRNGRHNAAVTEGRRTIEDSDGRIADKCSSDV